uniref:Uncharacterized protein F07F6.2 n=1 Tax=Caenorhabditis elegans TaxID=6239 RepID=YQP2_CAEEL|nr:RecName: Full=Uncharacterized protein F07F6.2 [Caenorhabditis elegans]
MFLRVIDFFQLHLRWYSVGLIFFSFIPIYYSIIVCQPQQFKIDGFELINPVFNKHHSTRSCTSATKSLQNGLIALFIFYALKIYKKVYLIVLYIILIIHFGFEIRNAKSETSRKYIAISTREMFMYYVELLLLYFQNLLLLPYICGGYFLIRHVHRIPSKEEVDRQTLKFKEEARRIKRLMIEEDWHVKEANEDVKNKIEQEGLKRKDMEFEEQLYHLRIEKVKRREQVLKQKLEEKKAKRRQNAERRKKRREIAMEQREQ